MCTHRDGRPSPAGDGPDTEKVEGVLRVLDLTGVVANAVLSGVIAARSTPTS